MARKKEDGTDLITNLSAILSELLPLFLEKWGNKGPRLEALNSKLGQLEKAIHKQNRRIRKMTILCVVLILWNIFLSVLLIIDWHI